MGVVAEVTTLSKIEFKLGSHICTCKPHRSLPDLSTWTWKCQWHKHTNPARNQTFQLSLLPCHPTQRVTEGHTSSVIPRVTIVEALLCLGAFILWKKPCGNPELGTVPGTPCCGLTFQEKRQRAKEQHWAQIVHIVQIPRSDIAEAALPLDRKLWAGPGVVLVLFSRFISTRGWSAGLEMQGLSSTGFKTSPGSTNSSRSLNQASTTPIQVSHHVGNPKSLQKWLSKTPSFCS